MAAREHSAYESRFTVSISSQLSFDASVTAWVLADSGVVDEHVETAEAGDRGLDEPGGVGLPAHVGFHEVRRRTLRLQIRRDAPPPVRVAVRERDPGPLLHEAPHRRLADPGGPRR